MTGNEPRNALGLGHGLRSGIDGPGADANSAVGRPTMTSNRPDLSQPAQCPGVGPMRTSQSPAAGTLPNPSATTGPRAGSISGMSSTSRHPLLSRSGDRPSADMGAGRPTAGLRAVSGELRTGLRPAGGQGRGAGYMTRSHRERVIASCATSSQSRSDPFHPFPYRWGTGNGSCPAFASTRSHSWERVGTRNSWGTQHPSNAPLPLTQPGRQARHTHLTGRQARQRALARGGSCVPARGAADLPRRWSHDA